MANKALFKSASTKGQTPATNTVNDAGGQAYAYDAKHALAQLAATGTLNDTFYKSAQEQLDKVKEFAAKVPAKYLAQVAVFSRERGFMKDMPALLTVLLLKKDPVLAEKIFDRTIDNGKMLRNFFQMIRSGVAGSKSMASRPSRLVSNMLRQKTPMDLLFMSIGNDPSLVDIIKMIHFKPKDKKQDALISYLMGKKFNEKLLPEEVREYEALKKGESDEIPKVPFEMLAGLDIGKKGWTALALRGGWHFIRMNLNNFQKYKVFESKDVTKQIADRLRDEEQIAKARMFPYQLMVAYQETEGVPHEIREALQDAMEIAIDNTPDIPDQQIYVLPDISGSMTSPVTGDRGSASSKVSCRDVAALISAALARKNRATRIIPFADQAFDFKFNPRDSVMSIAQKINALPGGGTDCSAPLRKMNQEKVKADLVVFASDNESWMDSGRHRSTGTMAEWKEFKKRNKDARLVCVDLAVACSTQAVGDDILNIGGFSDFVFEQIASFALTGAVKSGKKKDLENWVELVEAIKI